MEDNYSFCSECGNKVDGKSKFCDKCGVELKPYSLQTDFTKENVKRDTKRNIIIGLIITISLVIGVSLLNYKSIFSAYYLSQANKALNFEEKEVFLKYSMKYKVNAANSSAFINIILGESKINSVKAENALLSNKKLLNDDVFKDLYFNVANDKATTLIIDNKYKEAAEAYANCIKYGISVVNNTAYIKILGKYADSELIKKINMYEGEDPSNYYSVADIDNDGLLEVAVFEKNSSSEEYTTNNIKLFKCVNNKYSLSSTIESEAEYCMSVNISKASDDINGIFVAAGMGVHSGLQSLYIIKDSQLVSALEYSIMSLYPSEIKDIDGDKILELSCLDKDPNDQDTNNAEADKIVTWYKWDGKNDLTTVKTQQFPN